TGDFRILDVRRTRPLGRFSSFWDPEFGPNGSKTTLETEHCAAGTTIPAIAGARAEAQATGRMRELADAASRRAVAGQQRAPDGCRRAAHAARPRPARRPRPHGHEGRLRPEP